MFKKRFRLILIGGMFFLSPIAFSQYGDLRQQTGEIREGFDKLQSDMNTYKTNLENDLRIAKSKFDINGNPKPVDQTGAVRLREKISALNKFIELAEKNRDEAIRQGSSDQIDSGRIENLQRELDAMEGIDYSDGKTSGKDLDKSYKRIVKPPKDDRKEDRKRGDDEDGFEEPEEDPDAGDTELGDDEEMEEILDDFGPGHREGDHDHVGNGNTDRDIDDMRDSVRDPHDHEEPDTEPVTGESGWHFNGEGNWVCHDGNC